MLKQSIQNTIDNIRQELNPIGLCDNTLTETPPTIRDVLLAIKKIGENREYVMKTILAVYISTFLEKSNPLWLMIVGNPSSNKTTLVDLLKKNQDIYRLDTMTSNPFSSGQREKEKPKDLLPLLNGKCFIIKEYGTLFGRSDEMVKQLISDFVAIYDGEYSKHSPTRGTINIYSYFSHIGCVTPMALNSRQRYMNSVGARFLFLKIKPLTYDEKQKNLKSIWDNSNNKNKESIEIVVNRFCYHLKNKIQIGLQIAFPDETKLYLNKLALLTARARGIVITEPVTFKDKEDKKRTHYEAVDIQVEEPFRALKQLKKLAQALAIVNDNNEVGTEELKIVKRVVLSSMHVRRADIIDIFNNAKSYTAKEASEVINKSYRTTKRHLDELVSLQVLKSNKGKNELARSYMLDDEFVEIFNSSQELEVKIKELFNDNQ